MEHSTLLPLLDRKWDTHFYNEVKMHITSYVKRNFGSYFRNRNSIYIEDIVHDCFEVLHTQLEFIKNEVKNCVSYLNKIIFYRVMDYLNKHKIPITDVFSDIINQTNEEMDADEFVDNLLYDNNYYNEFADTNSDVEHRDHWCYNLYLYCMSKESREHNILYDLYTMFLHDENEKNRYNRLSVKYQESIENVRILIHRARKDVYKNFIPHYKLCL